MNIKENKTKTWTGQFKGVNFEIKCHTNEYDNTEHWTYYIIIFLNRIPEENSPNSFWLKGKKSGTRIIYDYYKHHVINNINFHYGCTWYSKENGFDGDEKVIKIGCDYSHYWDEGHDYDVNMVAHDCENTIEKFRELVPKYKYWCCGNGKLYDIEDGILRNDTFYSREYYGEKVDEFKNENLN